ncbi:hypothetical protein QO002_004331 [Pararhizobium capsulatum DSM 1112]|uniref:Uncharacterized protein n=1 Tax=Pararhizobium capsulatum DSM 1112 TaxID=1121113 RepID=A0ABU0BV64_9HYPH|nr:hypothetical protein [Pararhizobium capsulatum DSM 1112]
MVVGTAELGQQRAGKLLAGFAKRLDRRQPRA